MLLPTVSPYGVLRPSYRSVVYTVSDDGRCRAEARRRPSDHALTSVAQTEHAVGWLASALASARCRLPSLTWDLRCLLSFA